MASPTPVVGIPTKSKQHSDASKQLDDSQQLLAWGLIGGMTLLLILSYWNTLSRVAQAWETEQYSHGWLVPAIAVFLLLLRAPLPKQLAGLDKFLDSYFGDFRRHRSLLDSLRGEGPTMRSQFFASTVSERWAGVGLVILGVTMRCLSAWLTRFTFDNISIIPCLMGVFVMVGGWRTLRWAGPPLAFLIFMFPLPDVLMTYVLKPLQNYATMSSIFCLQTLGVDSYADALNTIVVGARQMQVVEACSGLRMLNIFMGLAVALAILMRNRPAWERIAIVASSIPIAFAVNVGRITTTGLAHAMELDPEFVQVVFHDYGGLAMMPAALIMLFVELQILGRIMLESEEDGTPAAPSMVGMPAMPAKKRGK